MRDERRAATKQPTQQTRTHARTHARTHDALFTWSHRDYPLLRGVQSSYCVDGMCAPLPILLLTAPSTAILRTGNTVKASELEIGGGDIEIIFGDGDFIEFHDVRVVLVLH